MLVEKTVKVEQVNLTLADTQRCHDPVTCNNGMLRHSLGGAVIFISLQHFILPCLTYCPACKPEVRGIAIRAVSQAGQKKVLLRNNQFGGIFQVKTLFQKLWPLLYKRAKLDLRLTKNMFCMNPSCQ